MITELKYKDRAEWLNLRHGYIGGSDAGAVVGLNPYKSAYTLWAEKTDAVKEFEGSLTTKVGTFLEEFVAKLFEEETGKKVRRKNRMLVNDKYPWACADLDRTVVGENAIVEIKTTNSYVNVRKFRDGEYPEQWYAQMVHYLAVSEADKAYLAVLSECRDFHVFELSRDEEEITALMTAEKAFWEHVENKTPVAPDGSADAGQTIGAVYPESNGDTVSLMGFENDLRQYVDIGKQIKELESIRDASANRIKAFMQDAGKGETDGYKVSWTTAERKTFDTKRFALEHADLNLDSYYKTSSSRMFKVSQTK